MSSLAILYYMWRGGVWTGGCSEEGAGGEWMLMDGVDPGIHHWILCYGLGILEKQLVNDEV